MQLSLTYHSLGVTISFCKFWFENGTLIQIRCRHLLGIWWVFIVDMLTSSFFLILHGKIYVDIYLKIFGCILVLYTHQIHISHHVNSFCISNMKNIKGKNIKELEQINFDGNFDSPNEFYNYATFIDILQSGCHYIILLVLVLKMTLWCRLDTATC